MKANLFCTSLLTLLLIGLPTAQALNSENANAVERLIAEVMGPSPIEEKLRRLTDEIGRRMSGSPQMRRAVSWALEGFRQAGVCRH